jgi:hypothetical protein
MLWFDSVGTQLYLWESDGNSSQWVPVVNQSGALTIVAATNAGRNLIHNPRFNIQQRGAGPWTTNGNYTADRWAISMVTDTVSFSVGALSDADRTAIADESAKFCLANTFTGNAASTAFTSIVQPIEDIRRLAGKTVTVSFWAVAASGAPKLGLNFWLFYGTGGSPSAAQFAQATGAAVTISTTWARYSAILTLPSAAGKTFGTNVGTDNSQLYIAYSSGAANNAGFGNIGVQSGTVRIWGVQLEIGSTATPLETIDPADDLRRCQRFYQTGIMQHYSYNSAGANYSQSTSLIAPMRAAPTMTFVVQNNTNCSITAVANLGSQQISMYGVVTAAGPFQAQASYTASADL